MDSSADKEGLQSAGRKEQSSRHGIEPARDTSAVPGAFGREGLEQDGETAVPSQPDVDELEEGALALDDDDLDLEADEEITEDEAERADGA